MMGQKVNGSSVKPEQMPVPEYLKFMADQWSETGDRENENENEYVRILNYIRGLEAQMQGLERKNKLIIADAERVEKDNRQLSIDRFKQFDGEDCWIFGNDEFDDLESLVCPVVIKPEQLLTVMKERAELVAQNDRLRGLVAGRCYTTVDHSMWERDAERLINEPPLVSLTLRDEKVSRKSVIDFVDFCVEREGHGKELMEMAFTHWMKEKAGEA